MDILKGIEEIAFIHLGDQDVVRHNLVQKIIKAYDNYAQEKSVIAKVPLNDCLG